MAKINTKKAFEKWMQFIVKKVKRLYPDKQIIHIKDRVYVEIPAFSNPNHYNSICVITNKKDMQCISFYKKEFEMNKPIQRKRLIKRRLWTLQWLIENNL